MLMEATGNENSELIISDISNLNEFGKSMDFQKDDVLVSLNGENIDLRSARKIFDTYAKETKSGDKVKLVVRRDVKGKAKDKKLKGKAVTVPAIEKYVLEFDKNATENQMKVRKAWLKP